MVTVASSQDQDITDNIMRRLNEIMHALQYLEHNLQVKMALDALKKQGLEIDLAAEIRTYLQHAMTILQQDLAASKTPIFEEILAKQHTFAKTYIENFLAQNRSLPKFMPFFLRQYLDILSLDNLHKIRHDLALNIDQSQGNNFLRGFLHLLEDFDEKTWMLKTRMNEKNAFKPGVNLAMTPGQVIMQNDLIELIHYAPLGPKVYKTPLLIIPAWINKYYILDLSEHNSLVRWLLSQGFNVFMISWVNPDASFASFDLNAYLHQGPIAAIASIKKYLSCRKINVLGFCLGGTLLAILLSFYQKQGIKTIKSAIFLASLLDFTNPGDISVFIDAEQVLQLEDYMAKRGYLDGVYMYNAFNLLRMKDLAWNFFVNNYLYASKLQPFDILHWNSDSTNMPYKMHIEYLRYMYLENRLITPNKLVVNGVSLDVSQITTPSFWVATRRDHIAPWESVYAGFKAIAGDKTFILGESGHIAGIINPPILNKYAYQITDGSIKSGSWWPSCAKWLKQRSGPKYSFSYDISVGIRAAPGTYVLA
jgi:polyhydroxyalkanoate synthase subunit PhaC